MKTKRFLTSSFALVFGLVLMTACSRVQEEKPLNAVTLSQEYQDDKEATVAKYNGKEIVVAGKVRVNLENPGKGGVLGFIGVKPTKGQNLTGLHCFYEKEDEDRFTRIAIGKIVAVKGTLSGEKENPRLQRCKLVREY
jgi:hypothetical protein